MRYLAFFGLILYSYIAYSQPLSRTFEIRYFTKDEKANGETDFKGESEWFDTEQRVDFLNNYADFASGFFENPELNKKIVSDKEIKALISGLKTQPLTSKRKTIPLSEWKAYGYKAGQDELKRKELENWKSNMGSTIENGELYLNNSAIIREIDTLSWRFKLEYKVKTINKGALTVKLNNDNNIALLFTISNKRLTSNIERQSYSIPADNDEWIKVLVEADFSQKKFNLFVNNKRIYDFISMPDTTLKYINKFIIISSGEAIVDDIFLFNHIPTNDANYPFISKPVIDENFEEKPGIKGWQKADFDDRHWRIAELPVVHGGVREAGEDLYLRHKIYIEDFERAVLSLETLDPGGEIWINNEVFTVIHNRYPYEFDISKYLLRNSENIIAVRVKPYTLNFRMRHTPTDHNIGWFLGRTILKLSSKCMIRECRITTKEIQPNALQSHKIIIDYPGPESFEGSLVINYYPWFPDEGGLVASSQKEISVRARIENEFEVECPINNAELWSADKPQLYRVEVLLKDKDGVNVDDYMTTTGIRLIEQKSGDLYINGKREMLNGAQIMGYRIPLETIARHHRCAPIETIAEEMLMIKKMDANLLRIHVHAETDTTDGINDPRYAEFADQMGIYLIWSTAAFTRAGEPWNVDFKAYPEFMKQVYNHPSIVIWEASNHPDKFKRFDSSVTNDYVEKIYNTIYSLDQSRLISPTSFWQHTHYGNYDGTIDHKGNPLIPVPEFNAPMVARGSQDAYTGYGADWSELRNAPNKWAASCLAAKDKAYFNFEHEESIAQPNWDLSKGKPWYHLQSYEKNYDKGSIGRDLSFDEWRASQAWQAFSAWESMKKQVLLGYDGFSWCSLHGGPNMGTYLKPLIDNLGHPKLAYYANKMIFQKIWAASNNVDVVYGPEDYIFPVIHNLGTDQKVDLLIELRDLKNKLMDRKIIRNISLESHQQFIELEGFRFKNIDDGLYAIQYNLIKSSSK